MTAQTDQKKTAWLRRRGVHGGRARAAQLTAAERVAIATKAAQARWQGNVVYASETKRMESCDCGDVVFDDLGERLRLQIDEQMHWAIWNEAHVDTAIGILRKWRRLRKAAARARARRQGAKA
jgi:hypothetical protein